MIGPMFEVDPARASPNPSKSVFLPSATTLSGISWYFWLTINSDMYLVNPGAAGSSPLAAEAAGSDSGQPLIAAVAASEVLKKSRRITGCDLRKWVVNSSTEELESFTDSGECCQLQPWRG